MDRQTVIEAFRVGASDVLIDDFSQEDFISCFKRLCPENKSRFLSPHLFSKPLVSAEYQENKHNWRDEFKPPENQQVHETSTTVHPPTGDTGARQIFISFLGRLEVFINGQKVLDWKGKKSRQLLAFIAYYKKPVFREVLMDQFWPSSSPASARNCLNVTLHQIRSSLQELCGEEDFIIFKDECYFINPNFDIQTDVSQLKYHWKKGRDFEAHGEIEKSLREYEKAAALYIDDFLIEFQYDAWCDLERENLKETNILILNKLSHYFSMDGKPRSAIELCNQILKEDRCREDIHRRLMRSYYRIGQKDRALRQYQKCVEYLKEDLDADPSQMTVKLYKKIRGN
jgi:DNA-binding SARP family transcriptional activator